MGLYEEIQNIATEKYIEINVAVECLAMHEGSIYKAIMVMLHYRFDEELCCYKKNDFYEFIDIDNDKIEEYSSWGVLQDIKQDIESKGLIHSKECKLSEEIKEKTKKYHWSLEDFYNLKSIESIADKLNTIIKFKKYKEQQVVMPFISKAPPPLKPVKGMGSSYSSSKIKASSDEMVLDVTSQEIEQLKIENEKLKIQLDKLNKKIEELKIQEIEIINKENAMIEEEITLQDSDLVFISILMKLLKNATTIGANKSQNKILQKIEDDYIGIKGLSKSRTDKVMSKANGLYKNLINK